MRMRIVSKAVEDESASGDDAEGDDGDDYDDDEEDDDDDDSNLLDDDEFDYGQRTGRYDHLLDSEGGGMTPAVGQHYLAATPAQGFHAPDNNNNNKKKTAKPKNRRASTGTSTRTMKAIKSMPVYPKPSSSVSSASSSHKSQRGDAVPPSTSSSSSTSSAAASDAPNRVGASATTDVLQTTSSSSTSSSPSKRPITVASGNSNPIAMPALPSSRNSSFSAGDVDDTGGSPMPSMPFFPIDTAIVKFIRLRDAERDIETDVIISNTDTREHLVVQLQKLFPTDVTRSPAYIMVNGIPLGLDPRRLVHEVSDGDTYQLGFLVLPFDTSEQRQRFGDASMLVLHAHILQESRTFMRSCCEGDEDRVTAMKMKRTIQQTNGETEGLAGLTGNVRLTFFCSEVDKIVRDFLEIANSSDASWHFMQHNRGVDVSRSIEKPQTPSGTNCVRGIATLPVPAGLIFSLILSTDMNVKSRYNHLLADVRVLEEVDRHTRVLYMKYVTKNCLLERACDFCVLEHWYRDSKNNYIVCGSSIKHDQIPSDATCYRGTAYASGYFIEPKSASSCTVKYITYVDLGIPLPPFVASLINDSQPMLLADMGKFARQLHSQRQHA